MLDPRLYKFLKRSFDLSPEEFRVVKHIILHQFFHEIGKSLVFVAAYAFLLSQYNAGKLPEMFILSAVLLLVVGRVYAYAELKLSPRRHLSLVGGLFGVMAMLLFAGVEWFEHELIAFALVVWYKISGVLSNLKFWALTEKLFQLRKNRRLFDLVQSTEIPSKLMAFLMVIVAVSYLKISFLLLAAAFFYVLAFFFLNRVFQIKAVKDYLAGYRQRKERETDISTPEDMLKFLLSGGYLLELGLLVFFIVSSFSLIEFSFVKRLQQWLDTETALLVFGSVLFLVGGLLSFLNKLIFRSRRIGRLGVKRAMLIMPVLLSVVATVHLLFRELGVSDNVIFWIVTFKVLIITIFRGTLHNPVLFAMYQTLNPQLRSHAFTVVQGVVEPLAMGFAGAALLFFRDTAYDSTSWLLLFTIGGWFVILFIISNHYLENLKSAIRLRYVEGSELATQNKDLLKILYYKLGSDKEEDIVYSLEMFCRLNVEELSEILKTLLTHRFEVIKILAINKIGKYALLDLQADMLALIEGKESERVKEAAVRAYCLYDNFSIAYVSELLENQSLQVQKGAIIGLLLEGDVEAASVARYRLAMLLASDNEIDNLTGLEVLLEVNDLVFSEAVIKMLMHHQEEIRIRAINVCGKLLDNQFVPYLIDFIRNEQHIGEATRSLVSFGEAALGDIEQEFAFSGQEPKPYLRKLCQVCGQIGSERAKNLLHQLLNYPWKDLQLEAYNALRQMGYKAQNPIEFHFIHDQLDRLLGQQFWFYNALLILEDTPSYALLYEALKSEIKILDYQINALTLFIDNSSSDSATYLYAQQVWDEEEDDFVEEKPERSIWKTMPKSLTDKLLATAGYYSDREKVNRLSSYYVNHLLDDISVVSVILREVSSYNRFNAWTKAAALYTLSQIDNPNLLRNVIFYLNCNNILLVEAAVEAIKRYCFYRGYKIEHLLKEFSSPARNQIFMGLLNDHSKPLMELEKVIILKSTRLFAETPEYALLDVASIVKESRIARGETIFRKGEKGTSMYIVYEGEIRLHDGQRTVTTLINGDFFGDLGLLDSNPRSTSATAERDSLLLRIDQDDFYVLLAARGEIIRSVMHSLCERIRTQSQTIKEIQMKKI